MKMTVKTWGIFWIHFGAWFFKWELPAVGILWLSLFITNMEEPVYQWSFAATSVLCVALAIFLAWDETHPEHPCGPTGYCSCGAECVFDHGGNCDAPAGYNNLVQELGYQQITPV